jgi:hypothetical protein
VPTYREAALRQAVATASRLNTDSTTSTQKNFYAAALKDEPAALTPAPAPALGTEAESTPALGTAADTEDQTTIMDTILALDPAVHVEEPGKDPRANESGSKGCGKIAQGASARAARHIHSMPAKQYNDAAPSIVSTGADSSLEHVDKGSVLKGQARGIMSYAEEARGNLPFQQPHFFNTLGKISLYPS